VWLTRSAQDPLAVENGMVELEIQLMLNSPTMGSVRERKKQSSGVPGSPDTLRSANDEDDDLPGFHSPTMRSGGASPLSSMSPMSGFGFLDVDGDKKRDGSNANLADDTQSSAQDNRLSGSKKSLEPSTSENVPLGSDRELKNQRSMVTTEGGSQTEKPIVRMPSLPDDQEEVSAGCCGGLFGGGKKKKKQKS